ncbi:hydrogenase maturation nickel metallochaperone HypA [Clostridium sp. YIM B02515]|uniref:Hydrogenase maturation factor HypA n=1 Tax=Clostridium rhizosphaerae TaxID=2803861 RepID=A0ABS1TF05_9CLOT|nr:hydrogenase maturation nickel metallochaperone HypA [Clostridium rhizosphaerae]MBL4937963.1 hydrogenase maturation nickel metallochaperone HypA [Clostridium rhizosphaerae]
MHELPITESIVRIASDEALKHNVSKINEIRIKIGEISGLVPECIQYYFDVVSAGTKAEGAKLIINKLPIVMKCVNCNFTGETDKFVENKCPDCGSTQMKMIGGNEFYIDSMEVEKDGD